MSGGDEVHVTFEDQQKINRFARLHAKTVELRDELATFDKDISNLNTALDEIETLQLIDEDQNISITEGEVFVKLNMDAGKQWIEKRKIYLDIEKKRIDENLEQLKNEMSDIKAELYSKFGVNTINLEEDTEDD